MRLWITNFFVIILIGFISWEITESRFFVTDESEDIHETTFEAADPDDSIFLLDFSIYALFENKGRYLVKIDSNGESSRSEFTKQSACNRIKPLYIWYKQLRIFHINIS
jgi:hypothetical protein